MTQKQIIVGGALALVAFLLARRAYAAVGDIAGGGVIGLRRSDDEGPGVSEDAGCTCFDPKPAIYVACGCSDPNVVEYQPPREAYGFGYGGMSMEQVP